MNTNVKMKIALTKEQSTKLRRASKNGKPATIRLSNDQLFNESGVDVELSEEQYKKAFENIIENNNQIYLIIYLQRNI